MSERPPGYRVVEPMRRSRGSSPYRCQDFPRFRPNLSPGEVFQGGAFGGTYFRDIEIDGVWYKSAHSEFESPKTDWFDGLNVKKQVTARVYSAAANKHKVRCGQSLDEWLSKGWIKTDFDSHGWFHWYCRFFLGRRCDDDERQVARWEKCAGKAGRWKRNLIAKCVRAGKPYDAYEVSPVVRQTLMHWAYELTEEHYDEYASLVREGKATSFVSQYTMKHVVSNKSKREEAEEVDPSAASGGVSGSSEKQDESRADRARKRARRKA